MPSKCLQGSCRQEDHTAQGMDHTRHSGEETDQKGKEGSPE